MRTYTTSQGDMWDRIAPKMYPLVGGEMQMHVLLAANPEYRDTVIFPANVQLTIPDVEKPPSAVNLPPWKRKG